ncbi:hypothetical protein P280DRAFT_371247, partial [Massarina eburnea CBS 473.64]
RPYSSSPAPRPERISVSARSNGNLTIDIFHSEKPASPVLLYLPSGTVIPDYEEEEERIISTLARASRATVARINYRASSVYQYPTPIHDTMLGYAWIKENLVDCVSPWPIPSRVGVCGELMGGSLAVMLGLTECRVGESGIGAASVNNPIVDWVFADELPALNAEEPPEPLVPEDTAFPADEDPMSPLAVPESFTATKPPKRAAKPPPPPSWQLYGDNAAIPTLTLLGERDVLFRKPEHSFDLFASPIHWFRSPRGNLIYPRDDDTLASNQPDKPVDYETKMNLLHYQALGQTPKPVELPTLCRCKDYGRIYPPAGFHLSPPLWQVTTGTESPLLDQATELTKKLRRSIARCEFKKREGRLGDGRRYTREEDEIYKAYAKTRVKMNTVNGIGLWTQQDPDSPWKENVERMGHFMQEKLNASF